MLKVMIAEDDLFMADMLEDVLIERGYDVCGIARTVEKAVELAERHKPDLAILDIRLAEGGLGTDVAARLKDQGRMGVLYASGHVGETSLTKADGDALLVKPYRPEDVVRALKIVEHIINSEGDSRRFPRGFSVLNSGTEDEAAPAVADTGLADQNIRLRRQQAELARFGTLALSERDLDKVLSEAVRLCAECLKVPYCTIYRYRPEENDLLAETGIGWNPGVIGRLVSRADESSPHGRSFINRGPAICYDLSKDAAFVLPGFYAEHGIVTTLDVYIGTASEPFGVLEIDSPVPRDYDRCDIDFLTGFANVLAEAVNASKRSAALRAANDRIDDMIGDRNRSLAIKNALLAEKNRLLDDKSLLTCELQHRVRNNLQLVLAILNKQPEATAEQTGIAGISAITRQVMTLAQVHEHLLNTGLSRTVDFGAYLSSLCTSSAALQSADHPNVGMACHSVPIMLDLDTVTALGLVISELIANSYAHKFLNGGGAISVSLTTNEPGNEATIKFADNGVGAVDRGDANGPDLNLVKRLMGQIGGSVALRSDQGNEWTLTFPVPPTASPGTSMAAA